MDTYRQFIGTIKRGMKEHGLSARGLARQVGISPSYVTRVLAGDRMPPTDVVIERIARALNLNANRLLWLAGRLPVFLRAQGPLTDEDLDELRRSYERIRQRHVDSHARGLR